MLWSFAIAPGDVFSERWGAPLSKLMDGSREQVKDGEGGFEHTLRLFGFFAAAINKKCGNVHEA